MGFGDSLPTAMPAVGPGVALVIIWAAAPSGTALCIEGSIIGEDCAGCLVLGTGVSRTGGALPGTEGDEDIFASAIAALEVLGRALALPEALLRRALGIDVNADRS